MLLVSCAAVWVFHAAEGVLPWQLMQFAVHSCAPSWGQDLVQVLALAPV
jgi:hypothetical protein